MEDNVDKENNCESTENVQKQPVESFTCSKSAIDDLPSTAVQSINFENDKSLVEAPDEVFTWKEFKISKKKIPLNKYDNYNRSPNKMTQTNDSKTNLIKKKQMKKNDSDFKLTLETNKILNVQSGNKLVIKQPRRDSKLRIEGGNVSIGKENPDRNKSNMKNSMPQRNVSQQTIKTLNAHRVGTKKDLRKNQKRK